jgi:hypothetical protein
VIKTCGLLDMPVTYKNIEQGGSDLSLEAGDANISNFTIEICVLNSQLQATGQ